MPNWRSLLVATVVLLSWITIIRGVFISHDKDDSDHQPTHNLSGHGQQPPGLGLRLTDAQPTPNSQAYQPQSQPAQDGHPPGLTFQGHQYPGKSLDGQAPPGLPFDTNSFDPSRRNSADSHVSVPGAEVGQQPFDADYKGDNTDLFYDYYDDTEDGRLDQLSGQSPPLPGPSPKSDNNNNSNNKSNNSIHTSNSDKTQHPVIYHATNVDDTQDDVNDSINVTEAHHLNDTTTPDQPRYITCAVYDRLQHDPWSGAWNRDEVDGKCSALCATTWSFNFLNGVQAITVQMKACVHRQACEPGECKPTVGTDHLTGTVFCCCDTDRCNSRSRHHFPEQMVRSLPPYHRIWPRVRQGNPTTKTPKTANTTTFVSARMKTSKRPVATSRDHVVCAFYEDSRRDNKTRSRFKYGPGLEAIGTIESDNRSMVCKAGITHCFTFFTVSTESDAVIKVAMQGCWDPETNGQWHEPGCESRMNKHYFCACQGNFCNFNFNQSLLASAITPEDSELYDIEPITSSYDPKKVVWITLVIFVFGSLLIVLVYLVYRMCLGRKWLIHLSMRSSRSTTRTDTSSVIMEGDVKGGVTSREFDPAKLKIKNVIVQGRYSQVRYGKVADTDVAVKIYHQQHRQYFVNERSAFSLPFMDHKNVVKFFGAVEHQNNNDTNQTPDVEEGFDSCWGCEGVPGCILVTGLAEHGTLTHYLRHNTLDWPMLCTMLLDVCSGLVHLHTDVNKDGLRKPALAHRDINSQNILVKSDLTCVIADLGFTLGVMGSKVMRNGHWEVAEKSSLEDVGTLRYMAPEVFDGAVNLRDCEASLKQIDVYALGLVLWECATRCRDLYQGSTVPEYQLPFQAETGSELTFGCMQSLVVKHKTRPKFPSTWDTSLPAVFSLKETIEDCWDTDSEARLTSRCVLERVTGLNTLASQAAAGLLYSTDHLGHALNKDTDLVTQNCAIRSSPAQKTNAVSDYGNLSPRYQSVPLVGCHINRDVKSDEEIGLTTPLMKHTNAKTVTTEEDVVSLSWEDERASLSGSTMDTLLPLTPVGDMRDMNVVYVPLTQTTKPAVTSSDFVKHAEKMRTGMLDMNDSCNDSGQLSSLVQHDTLCATAVPCSLRPKLPNQSVHATSACFLTTHNASAMLDTSPQTQRNSHPLSNSENNNKDNCNKKSLKKRLSWLMRSKDLSQKFSSLFSSSGSSSKKKQKNVHSSSIHDAPGLHNTPTVNPKLNNLTIQSDDVVGIELETNNSHSFVNEVFNTTPPLANNNLINKDASDNSYKLSTNNLTQSDLLNTTPLVNKNLNIQHVSNISANNLAQSVPLVNFQNNPTSFLVPIYPQSISPNLQDKKCIQQEQVCQKSYNNSENRMSHANKPTQAITEKSDRHYHSRSNSVKSQTSQAGPIFTQSDFQLWDNENNKEKICDNTDQTSHPNKDYSNKFQHISSSNSATLERKRSHLQKVTSPGSDVSLIPSTSVDSALHSPTQDLAVNLNLASLSSSNFWMEKEVYDIHPHTNSVIDQTFPKDSFFTNLQDQGSNGANTVESWLDGMLSKGFVKSRNGDLPLSQKSQDNDSGHASGSQSTVDLCPLVVMGNEDVDTALMMMMETKHEQSIKDARLNQSWHEAYSRPHRNSIKSRARPKSLSLKGHNSYTYNTGLRKKTTPDSTALSTPSSTPLMTANERCLSLSSLTKERCGAAHQSVLSSLKRLKNNQENTCFKTDYDKHTPTDKLEKHIDIETEETVLLVSDKVCSNDTEQITPTQNNVYFKEDTIDNDDNVCSKTDIAKIKDLDFQDNCYNCEKRFSHANKQSHAFKEKSDRHHHSRSNSVKSSKDLSKSSEKIRRRIKTPVSFKGGRLSLYDDRLMSQSLDSALLASDVDCCNV